MSERGPVDEVTDLVGYVLIRRRGDDELDELQCKRIFNTEPEGPVVGSMLTHECRLGPEDEVIDVIPAADNRRTSRTEAIDTSTHG